jgi:hypothetical protein
MEPSARLRGEGDARAVGRPVRPAYRVHGRVPRRAVEDLLIGPVQVNAD